MLRNLTILATLIVIVAMPFLFRQKQDVGAWKSGDPQLVIISPHNEAIRYEFEHAFSRWHQAKYGQPVKIDWRNIGGTTEISRYLQGEFATSAKSWWNSDGKTWPSGATDAVVAGRPPVDKPELLEVYKAYRAVDDPEKISAKVDLFFGGGQFDHNDAFNRGFSVEPWPRDNPPESVKPSLAQIDEVHAGEIWRTPTLFGTAVSTFGIVYNLDRLRELGVTNPPTTWDDLADYRYIGQVGVTDPTKSGSIAKAFEMLVHAKMKTAVAGYLAGTGVAPDQIDSVIAANEQRIDAHQKTKTADGKARPKWDVPEDLVAYQSALEAGWVEAMYLIQRIGGNARYFTDSATKVSIDVSIGDAAIGMSIDFYGRYQAQMSAAPDGSPRMVFITPVGGTSVSCDPISLLRGAPQRKIAVRFIEFTLSEEGQRLWTYRPGVKDADGHPIGPTKYALRRLPIRHDFYVDTENGRTKHKQFSMEDLSDPTIDPYEVAKQFTYYPRWTGSHFGIMREIVRAMCLDSGIELRDAWQRAHRDGVDPQRLALIHQLPTVKLHDKSGALKEVPLNWRTALGFRDFESLEYMREWTGAFRTQYENAAK
jgi:ABC-type Fe3+ transport system substrate-binding protein